MLVVCTYCAAGAAKGLHQVTTSFGSKGNELKKVILDIFVFLYSWPVNPIVVFTPLLR